MSHGSHRSRAPNKAVLAGRMPYHRGGKHTGRTGSPKPHKKYRGKRNGKDE